MTVAELQIDKPTRTFRLIRTMIAAGLVLGLLAGCGSGPDRPSNASVDEVVRDLKQRVRTSLRDKRGLGAEIYSWANRSPCGDGCLIRPTSEKFEKFDLKSLSKTKSIDALYAAKREKAWYAYWEDSFTFAARERGEYGDHEARTVGLAIMQPADGYWNVEVVYLRWKSEEMGWPVTLVASFLNDDPKSDMAEEESQQDSTATETKTETGSDNSNENFWSTGEAKQRAGQNWPIGNSNQGHAAWTVCTNEIAQKLNGMDLYVDKWAPDSETTIKTETQGASKEFIVKAWVEAESSSGMGTQYPFECNILVDRDDASWTLLDSNISM